MQITYKIFKGFTFMWQLGQPQTFADPWSLDILVELAVNREREGGDGQTVTRSPH